MKGKTYSKTGKRQGMPTYRMPSRLKAGEERRLNAEPPPLPKEKPDRLRDIEIPRIPKAR